MHPRGFTPQYCHQGPVCRLWNCPLSTDWQVTGWPTCQPAYNALLFNYFFTPQWHKSIVFLKDSPQCLVLKRTLWTWVALKVTSSNLKTTFTCHVFFIKRKKMRNLCLGVGFQPHHNIYWSHMSIQKMVVLCETALLLDGLSGFHICPVLSAVILA